MGAGGIIHQQAKALVAAANDPSFYQNVSQGCQQQIDAITAKPELSRNRHDVLTLLSLLHVAVHS